MKFLIKSVPFIFLAEAIYSWYFGIWGYVILYLAAASVSGAFIYNKNNNGNRRS